MTHKIIKTDNYLLVVDDSEIKVGDYFYSIREILEQAIIDYPKNEHHGVIIAHLPLNGSPILEGVDLLPPYSRHQEDGVEELAKLKYPVIMRPNGRTLAGGHYDVDVNYSERSAYKYGYNKAREKYKYTDKDLENILLDFIEFQHPYHEPRGSIVNRFIKQLNTSTDLFWYSKYPTEFECEMKYFEVDMGLGEECIEYGQIPQKITTAQGVQWVGKYK